MNASNILTAFLRWSDFRCALGSGYYLTDRFTATASGDISMRNDSNCSSSKGCEKMWSVIFFIQLPLKTKMKSYL